MIMQAVFVALLLCAGTNAGTSLTECDTWACFAQGSCLTPPKVQLVQVLSYVPLNGDCSGIIMIRPYSTKRWEVVIEAWDAAATDVKVLQGANEIFTCKNTGTSSTTLPGFEVLAKYSDRTISCRFLVGDGQNEVLVLANGALTLSHEPSAVVSTTTWRQFTDHVKTRVTCDLSNIQFEDAFADEVAERPQLSLDAISCTKYKLQYKMGANYVDATGGIKCEGTTLDPQSDYKYVITTAEGVKEEQGQFHARCGAKVCSLCTLPASTPAGALQLEDAGGECKTLKCPKFIKIGGADATAKFDGVCQKMGSGDFKFAIEGKAVEKVDCVDKLTCKPLTGCSGDCKLNSETGMPFCADDKTLSIGGQLSVNVTCDSSRGQLTYTEAGKAAADLPSNSTFSCTAAAKAEEKVATGGVLGPLQACIAVACVLSLALAGGSIALWLWKKNKKAAENNNDNKTGEN